MAEGFRSRVDTNVVPLSNPDPNASRSGVAQGLQELGQAGEHAIAEQKAADRQVATIQYEQATQEQIANGTSTLAKAKAAFDVVRRQAREAPPEDITGHQQRMLDQWAQVQPDLMQGITSRDAQINLQRQTELYTTEIAGSEGEFETATRIGNQIGDAKRADSLSANRLYAMGPTDQKSIEGEMGSMATFHAGLSKTIGESKALDMNREYVGQAYTALIEGNTARGNFEFARQMLATDMAKRTLDPKDYATLDHSITYAQKSAEAAQRAQEAAARLQVKHQTEAQEAHYDTGEGTPAEMAATAKVMRANGDEAGAVRLEAKAGQRQAVAGWKGQDPRAIDNRVTVLQHKQATTGLSAGEAAELAGLPDLASQERAMLNGEGGAMTLHAWATGQQIPPLDMTKPATFAARGSLARAGAEYYGQVQIQPLLPEDVRQLKQLAVGPVPEKMQALQLIAGLHDSRAQLGAARQVSDAKDSIFRVAAMYMNLPGGRGYDLAKAMLEGDQIAKANPKLVLPGGRSKLMAEYATTLAGGLGSDFSSDVLTAADALYAGKMTAAGRTVWDETEYRNSIEVALGRYKQGNNTYGGTIEYNGGRMMIPSPGWTGEGLTTRLARADDARYSAAAHGAKPIWADGSPVTAAQLRNTLPVYLGGTLYGFRIVGPGKSGDLIGRAGGGAFVIDAEKLPYGK